MIEVADVNQTDQEIVGRMISVSGDVAYKIGATLYPKNAETIFTTKVESWDAVISSWFWMILAAVLGGVCTLASGILLGFLEITRERVIWWPW